jgi:uncharacterized membrane protein YqhA
VKRLLELSRYLVLIGVIGALVTSVTAFFWGLKKTALVVVLAAQTSDHPLMTVALIEVMDAFLIAVALGIFATSLYELFIQDLDLPKWMEVSNLHHLKVRMTSVVILVLGVKFLEYFASGNRALDVLLAGAGIALVSGALVAFSRVVPDD